jgi:NADH-quinone oxidoreductase subunit G
VIAHASLLTEALRAHADVVFPAETYAEKEGTVVHPDGRIQRLRPAVAHPGAVRAGWSVLSDLAARLDLDLGVLSGPMATAQLVEAVPFYGGLTLEEIGGRGVRWQERAAGAFGGGTAPSAAAGGTSNAATDGTPSAAAGGASNAATDGTSSAAESGQTGDGR